MNDYSETIESLSIRFDEKRNKKIASDLLQRLCYKLQDESNMEIDDLLKTTFEHYREVANNEEIKLKEYYKSLRLLRKKVKEIYGYTAKGELKDQYTSMGIALGVCFGAPFSVVNPAFIGIGIPIGLAIGIAIGQNKEKIADDEGKTY